MSQIQNPTSNTATMFEPPKEILELTRIWDTAIDLLASGSTIKPIPTNLALGLEALNIRSWYKRCITESPADFKILLQLFSPYPKLYEPAAKTLYAKARFVVKISEFAEVMSDMSTPPHTNVKAPINFLCKVKIVVEEGKSGDLWPVFQFARQYHNKCAITFAGSMADRWSILLKRGLQAHHEAVLVDRPSFLDAEVTEYHYLPGERIRLQIIKSECPVTIRCYEDDSFQADWWKDATLGIDGLDQTDLSEDQKHFYDNTYMQPSKLIQWAQHEFVKRVNQRILAAVDAGLITKMEIDGTDIVSVTISLDKMDELNLPWSFLSGSWDLGESCEFSLLREGRVVWPAEEEETDEVADAKWDELVGEIEYENEKDEEEMEECLQAFIESSREDEDQEMEDAPAPAGMFIAEYERRLNERIDLELHLDGSRQQFDEWVDNGALLGYLRGQRDLDAEEVLDWEP